MFTKNRIIVCGLLGLLSVVSGSSAYAHEWSSAMGQARSLQRAARDLCRAIERSQVQFAIRASARLGESIHYLVDQLDHDACIADVREAQNEVQVWLERTIVAVESRCDLGANPRLANALQNVLSNFELLSERIDDRILPVQSISRRPVYYPPVAPIRILPYPFPITCPSPIPLPQPRIREPQPRMTFPPARNPGDWHQSNVPGYVPPGAWHHTQIPGSISPGSWHHTNTP